MRRNADVQILKWTYDAETDEYYLSLFTSEQPDLNWENPEVRAAVHDVMKFWLERGACGYRMDVINLISKDQGFPDAEPALGPDRKYHPGSEYYLNGPRMHEYLQEIKREVLQKYGAITVGEMPGVSDIREKIRTVGRQSGELNMMFIFDVVDIDTQPGKVRMTLQDWSVKDLARAISKWQRAMIEHDGWNSVFIENHDNPRSVSRYCDDSNAYRGYGAKLLALMQTTLSGTLFVYQGEELGMRNVWLILVFGPYIYPFQSPEAYFEDEAWPVSNTAPKTCFVTQYTFWWRNADCKTYDRYLGPGTSWRNTRISNPSTFGRKAKNFTGMIPNN